MEENGKDLPCISIAWDEAAQMPLVEFDPKVFRTWTWVKALLQMAVEHADAQARLAQVRSMQMQAQLQKQDQVIRQKLALG